MAQRILIVDTIDASALGEDVGFDFKGGTSEAIRLLQLGHHPGNEGIWTVSPQEGHSTVTPGTSNVARLHAAVCVVLRGVYSRPAPRDAPEARKSASRREPSPRAQRIPLDACLRN